MSSHVIPEYAVAHLLEEVVKTRNILKTTHETVGNQTRRQAVSSARVGGLLSTLAIYAFKDSEIGALLMEIDDLFTKCQVYDKPGGEATQ